VTNPAVRLRPTRTADIGYVVGLEANPTTAPFINPWARQRHVASIEDPDENHAIIEASGRRVGFVILAGLQDPTGVELRRLVIGPKGQRYGRSALAAVLAWAQTRQESRVWLDVYDDNARAIALYRSAGFKLIDAATTDRGRRLLILEWRPSGVVRSAGS